MQRTTMTEWAPVGPLADSAARGGVVTAAGTVVRFVAQLATTVVVARILGPAEYGFAAVVVIVAGLAELLRTGGFAAAVTSATAVSGPAATTLHRIAAVTGLALAGLTVALAVPVTGVLGFGGSAVLMALLGIAFLGAGTAAVPGALLARNLRFRPLAAVEVLAMTSGCAVAISAALLGVGPLALVLQAVVSAVMLAAGAVIRCPWSPGPALRIRELRHELGFAANVTSVQVVTFCARNVDRIVVGIVGGPIALGLYTQASQLLVLPLDQVGGALQRVAVPVLARVRADRARFVRAYRRTAALTCLLLWPVFAVLLVLADSVVEVLFGSAWAGSAPLFRILAIGGIAQALGTVTVWVFVATGQGARQTVWALVSRPVLVGACIVAAPWGPAAVAVATAASAVVLIVPAFLVAARVPGLRLRDLIAPVLAPGIVAVVAGGCAWIATATMSGSGAFTELVLGAAAALVGAALVAFVLPPVRRELLLVVRAVRPARAAGAAA